jgi:hypothetical protein
MTEDILERKHVKYVEAIESIKAIPQVIHTGLKAKPKPTFLERIRAVWDAEIVKPEPGEIRRNLYE